MTGVHRSEEGRQAVLDAYRGFLERWPVSHQRRRVPTREGATFVVSSGPPDAPPLVLLHGGATASHIWMGDVAAWSERFRVHAVDLIGEAGLSAPSRPPLDSDAHVLWLDDVLDALGADRASFVGASLGGYLALAYALAKPQRVGRLVLVSPAGLGRQRPSFLLAALALMPLGDWGRRRLQRIVFGGTDLGPDGPEMLDHVALVQAHLRPRVVRFRPFAGETLARLPVPVLAIVGARDPLLDSAGTRRLLEAHVADVEVHVLPDAGHAVVGETQKIRDFLTAGEPTPSLRARLEQGLRDALRRRDRTAVPPLRSVLGALDNAGAVPLSEAAVPVAGRNVDVPRRDVSETDALAVLRRETEERRGALGTYERLGQTTAAQTLRSEIAVLEHYGG